jgi:4-hydroxy-tetrahydrodipicolinate synthase
MKKKQTNISYSGIYLPLLTPFYKGKFDGDSLGRLMADVDSHVDGFIPCLSSGEGALLSDDIWSQLVQYVRSNSKKTVVAGIKRFI